MLGGLGVWAMKWKDICYWMTCCYHLSVEILCFPLQTNAFKRNSFFFFFEKWCVYSVVSESSWYHGQRRIFLSRILEWVAVSSSRGSSRSRDRTQVSCISGIGKQILYHWVTWEALIDKEHIANVGKVGNSRMKGSLMCYKVMKEPWPRHWAEGGNNLKRE